MARLLGPAVVGALVLLVPQVCAACSCAFMEMDELVAQSGAVFSGTITERSDPFEGAPAVSSSDLIEYTVEVDTVYSGEVAATTIVSSARDSASCGVELTVGKTYLILLDSGPDAITTSCNGTTELSLVAPDDLASLGEGSPPAAGSGGSGGSGQGSASPLTPATAGEPAALEWDPGSAALPRTLWWGLGGVGLVAAALLAAIWWPRGRPAAHP
ncbi:MAG: hypothetical protein Q4F65_04220 [Propionibacteriaceae bacterium]|nr:hypothetical protein [Propionibacteriaceae bacterium]